MDMAASLASVWALESVSCQLWKLDAGTEGYIITK
jgi:hypothetical protein